MSIVEKIEQEQMKSDIPHFHAGDTVRVHVKIKEGDKERIQVFEGTVMGRRRAQNHSTFTVRKISFGHGVERIFPLHSPTIDKIERVKAGQVRRAKLGYLRARRGKAARIRKARTEHE
jgi:large subunit ribosomal protein L19